jgi:Fungal chitosanase of glycosyl hydrolase group 75
MTMRGGEERLVRLNFKAAEDFRGTRILRQARNIAYAYETAHAAADADGAPTAYHPDDVGKNCRKDAHTGLDCLGNAGYPHSNWWKSVLVPDPGDETQAYVQPDGQSKGFFVSATSLRAPGGSKFELSTYVDATTVPFVVNPTGIGALPHMGKPGDVGFATHLASAATTSFIIGDAGGGSEAKLGEGSIALFTALGFPNANPRTGAGLPRDVVQYIIFPGSRLSGAGIWPRTNADIRAQVAELLRTTPGIS